VIRNIIWAALLLCNPLFGMNANENDYAVNPKTIQAVHQTAELIIKVGQNTPGQQTKDLRYNNTLSPKYMQLATGLILKDPGKKSNLQLYTPFGIYKVGTSSKPAVVIQALQNNENIVLEPLTRKGSKVRMGYQINLINDISLSKAIFRFKQAYIPAKEALKRWNENRPKDAE